MYTLCIETHESFDLPTQRDRLLLCECRECKNIDPNRLGMLLPAWKVERHNQPALTAAAFRARGRGGRAMLSARARAAPSASTARPFSGHSRLILPSLERHDASASDSLEGTRAMNWPHVLILDRSDFDRVLPPRPSPRLASDIPPPSATSSIHAEQAESSPHFAPQTPSPPNTRLGLYEDFGGEDLLQRIAYGQPADNKIIFHQGDLHPLPSDPVNPGMLLDAGSSPSSHTTPSRPASASSDLSSGFHFESPTGSPSSNPSLPINTSVEAYQQSNPHWHVRAVLLLTAFLHSEYHVTFRACNLLLSVMRIIFTVLLAISQQDSMPATLQSTLKHLGLEDRFQVRPVCSKCHKIFPAAVSIRQFCPRCHTRIFPKPQKSLMHRLTRTEPPPPPPTLAAPFCPLETLLKELLSRSDIEDAADNWHPSAHDTGIRRSIKDGNVVRELNGPDGLPFFRQDQYGELRLGLTLAFDW
jgi:hypothetical protein